MGADLNFEQKKAKFVLNSFFFRLNCSYLFYYVSYPSVIVYKKGFILPQL